MVHADSAPSFTLHRTLSQITRSTLKSSCLAPFYLITTSSADVPYSLSSNMVAERIYRVAYISTSRSEQEIRSFLSECGVIRGIYPWNAVELGQVHFFVEFDHHSSVKHATALQQPVKLCRVQSVALDPQLASNFMSVAPPSSPSYHKARRDGHRHRSAQEAREEKHDGYQFARLSPGRRRPPASARFHHPRRPSPVNTSHYGDRSNGKENKYVPRVDITSRNLQTPKAPGPLACQDTADVVTKPSHSLSTRPRQNSKLDLFSPSCYSPSDVGIDLAPDLRLLPSLFSANAGERTPQKNAIRDQVPTTGVKTLVLNYQGEQFCCDLEALTENPDNVIFMLQQTATSVIERDKWMVVAAHYRTQQNISAAIAVVTSMVEAMMSPAVGLVDDDLRPAYLMLASCYNDLRRQIRRQEKTKDDTGNCYLQKAQEFLRKVYGTDVPTFPAEEVGAPLSCTEQTPTGHCATNATPATHASDTSAFRTRALERDLQSLRDRNASNLANLSEIRDAKRKLEDKLEDERVVRRRMEKDIQSQKHELRMLRRAEKCALEQCKKEVETRRKAEERAAEAQDLKEKLKNLSDELNEKGRKVMEYTEKDMRRRDMCAKAGALLTKAANAEFEEIGNLLQIIPTRQAYCFTSSPGDMDMVPPGLSYRRDTSSTNILSSPR